MDNITGASCGGDSGTGDAAHNNAKSTSDAAGNEHNNSPQPAQRAQTNGLSAADELSQLARAALLSQQNTTMFSTEGTPTSNQQAIAADLAAALAATSSAVPTSSTVTTSQPVLTSSDGTLNALLLGNGISNLPSLGNLNQSALGTLLGDAAAAQLAELQANACGAVTTGGNDGTVPGTTDAATAEGATADADEEYGSRGHCSTQPNNKQLSSRYRGVCWNKKNKRWQAAINSGGKYIYLGSFTSEDDAAKQFDRAAIKIRGKKAKLNFLYADYVDAQGNLLEDIILPVSKEDAKLSSSFAARSNRYSRGGDYGDDGAYGADIGSSALPGDLLNQAALALVGQSGWGSRGDRLGLGSGLDGDGGATAFCSGNPRPAQSINMSDLKSILPKGCSADYMLPGLDVNMFGLVYKHDVTGQRGCGVWTGYTFHIFGLYSDEQDAKQTVLRGMELLHEDRQARTPVARAPAVTAAMSASALTDPDPLIAALGLGSLRSSTVGANAPSTVLGASGASNKCSSSSMAGLANYDIARAAQLAKQAAADQGLSMPMSFAPLSLGLPAAGAASAGVVQQQQQQQERAPQLGSSQTELQLKLQQIMQWHDDASQSRTPPAAAASTTAATGDGDMLSRLGNLDVAQLRWQLAGSLGDSQQHQQQPPQLPARQLQQVQQQLVSQLPLQQQPAPPASSLLTGALNSASIEELLSVVAGANKRSAPAPTAAVSSNATASWSELLGLTAGITGDAAAAPALKRLRTCDTGAAVAGMGSVAAAAAPGSGDIAAGTDKMWASLSKVGLQDALKSLYAMTSQAQQL